MNEQTSDKPQAIPPVPPDLDTRTSARLQLSFAIVGAMIGMGMMHFDLDDRNWSYQFETAVTEVARTLRQYQG